MNESAIFSVVSLAAFLVASGLLALGFKETRQHRLFSRLGYLMFLIGTLSATVLALKTQTSSYLFASAVCWATIISWFVWQLEIVGAFTAPVVALTLMYGIFFSPMSSPSVSHDMGPAMRIHVASAIIGQSFAVVACGISLLFIWLDKKLKKRQLNDLPQSFPAISNLTNALNIALWIGFAFISLGLVSGALYFLVGSVPSEMNIMPKVIWAVFVWLWYLSILALKGILSYRPQRVARLSLIGFALLAVSWFGLIFVAPWRPL
jgi:ABC-type uncharacterized transport system permease subunit